MRQRIGTQNIAKFDKALTLAFDLLISVSPNGLLTYSYTELQTTHHGTHHTRQH